METNIIHTGDSREVLSGLPAESVNCIVTSPPYYGLRDYGTALWQGGSGECDHKPSATPNERGISSSTLSGGKEHTGYKQEGFKSECARCGAVRIDRQMGLEETPEEYVINMVFLFAECRRVLKKDGTLWLNIGDSYAANRSSLQPVPTNTGNKSGHYGITKVPSGMKPKDLIGIPWMLAFALRADGWYLRQDIIWHKPNPMPESVTDRCTKAHEYIFLFSKNQKYYYDAVAIHEPSQTYENRPAGIVRNREYAYDSKENNHPEAYRKKVKLGEKSFSRGQANGLSIEPSGNGKKEYYEVPLTRNKRSVWTVTTKSFSEAHFATFPEELITDCIKAGCPEGGVVLDPFMGAGTTALVAAKLDRKYIGIELNPSYVAIAEKRLQNELGMFYKV